jgi:Flp pilus assembly protein TadB
VIGGAVLATAATVAAILGARRESAVARRLARLAPGARPPARLRALFVTQDLARSGLDVTAGELVRAKMIGALAGAAVGATLMLFVQVGLAVVVVLAYAGFVIPTLYVERVASDRRSASARALVTLVEWTEALVASGRPVESAFVAIAARGVGAGLADRALRAAAASYALGAPLFASLAREAEAAEMPGFAEVARDLERARDLGRGALVVLRDQRDRLRAAERARTLDAAARVEGQLMLVVVLCYLPALMLLVVIPLFLGLLEGLFV